MSRTSGQDLVVVIRAAGERTAEACQALVQAQVGDAPVLVVSEQPFEQALRSCFTRALEQGRRWTLTLDADVLLRPGAVAELLAAAEAMPAHYVQLEGRILDKVTGQFRQAGHRVYRSALLATVLQQVPTNGETIRPERETLRRMGALGHPSRRVPTVVGLHDHHQYHADLYRKAVVHARKHAYHLEDLFARCLQRRHKDPDLAVVLKGLCDGLYWQEELSIDKRLFATRAAEALAVLGLHEKEALPADGITPAAVLKALGRQRAPDMAVQDVDVQAADGSLQLKDLPFGSFPGGAAPGMKAHLRRMLSGLGEQLEDWGRALHG